MQWQWQWSSELCQKLQPQTSGTGDVIHGIWDHLVYMQRNLTSHRPCEKWQQSQYYRRFGFPEEASSEFNENLLGSIQTMSTNFTVLQAAILTTKSQVPRMDTTMEERISLCHLSAQTCVSPQSTCSGLA